MIIYTVINHQARKAMGISEAEYCLLDLIYKYATNPNGKVPGWCYASRPTIAEEREITVRGLQKMIARLHESGLLNIQPNSGHLRTTQRWFDAVICAKNIESSGELSSCDGVNLVHGGGELSSGGVVNLVPIRGELSSPNKSKDKSKEITVNDKPSHTPASECEAVEIETVEVEILKEKNFTGGAAQTSLAAEQREAIEAAESWCATNSEQVRWWRDIARFNGDISPVIAGFFSHWWSERDRYHKCRTAPIEFFQSRFLKWLQDEQRIQQQHTQNRTAHASQPSHSSSTHRKPARANGYEDAYNPATVADLLRDRHGVGGPIG